MIHVTFQIPGKVERIEVSIIPRVGEIVVLWEKRWVVIDVVHNVVVLGGSVITINLYPNRD